MNPYTESTTFTGAQAPPWRLRLSTCSLLLACLLLPASQALAHPHYFVKVDVRLQLDEQGRLQSLQQDWYFDEMVSAILLDDMQTLLPGRPPQNVLDQESQRLFRDLRPYDFYSHLRLDGEALSLPEPDHQLRITHPLADAPEVPILKYTLTFEWSEPVSLWDQTLQWSVYDPTYYAAYHHRSADSIRIVSGPQSQCRQSLKQPQPNQAMTAYALSLDKTQRDSQGLGQHFAEQVDIHCQPADSPG